MQIQTENDGQERSLSPDELVGLADRHAVTLASQAAGGDQQLRELLTWAESNLPASEIRDLNERLATPGKISGAIEDLLTFRRMGARSERIKASAVAGGAQSVAEARDIWQRSKAGDIDALRRLHATDQSLLNQAIGS